MYLHLCVCCIILHAVKSMCVSLLHKIIKLWVVITYIVSDGNSSRASRLNERKKRMQEKKNWMFLVEIVIDNDRAAALCTVWIYMLRKARYYYACLVCYVLWLGNHWTMPITRTLQHSTPSNTGCTVDVVNYNTIWHISIRRFETCFFLFTNVTSGVALISNFLCPAQSRLIT